MGSENKQTFISFPPRILHISIHLTKYFSEYFLNEISLLKTLRFQPKGLILPHIPVTPVTLKLKDVIMSFMYFKSTSSGSPNISSLLNPKEDNFSRVTWVLSIFRKEDKVMEYEKAI